MTVALVTWMIVDLTVPTLPMLVNTSFQMRDHMTMVYSGEVMNCMIPCHVTDHMTDHMIGLMMGHMTQIMEVDQG